MPPRLLTRGLLIVLLAALGTLGELGSELYRSARNEAPGGWARYSGLPAVVGAIDRLALDAMFQLRRESAALPAASDPVIVGIDQDYLDRVKVPFSVSQHALGTLLANIAAQEPRVIVVDLILPDKRFSQGISILGAEVAPEIALARGLRVAGTRSRIVLARTWDPIKREFRAILPEFVLAADVRGLAAGSPRAENVLGSALHCADEGGIVRSYPGSWCQPLPGILTLSELAAGTGRDARPAGLVNYLVGQPFQYLRAVNFLDPARGGATSALKGRPVLVGSVLPFEDRISAPVALAAWPQETAGEPGVLLQAQLLRTLLTAGPIPPLAPGWIALLMLALAAPMLLGRWELACAGVAATFALACVASFFALGERLWIPLGGASVVALLALAYPIASNVMAAAHEKRWLLRVFGGYVSPRMMKQIVAGGRSLLDAPSKKDVSVLFVDMRGFTPLCESMPPDTLVATLGQYRDVFVDAVHDAGGTVVSFTGDGLMAIYGAPDDLPNHAEAAVKSALDMVAGARRIAERAIARGEVGIRIGVGVNCGTALVGIFKASSRHEYGALGDIVNVAARLETLTKECGYPIVVSAAVNARLPAGHGHDLGPRELKGHHPVHVFGMDVPAESAAQP